jgi:hypothetical protein
MMDKNKSLVKLGRSSIVASEVISSDDLARLDNIRDSLMLSVDTRTIWRTLVAVIWGQRDTAWPMVVIRPMQFVWGGNTGSNSNVTEEYIAETVGGGAIWM